MTFIEAVTHPSKGFEEDAGVGLGDPQITRGAKGIDMTQDVQALCLLMLVRTRPVCDHACLPIRSSQVRETGEHRRIRFEQVQVLGPCFRHQHLYGFDQPEASCRSTPQPSTVSEPVLVGGNEPFDGVWAIATLVRESRSPGPKGPRSIEECVVQVEKDDVHLSIVALAAMPPNAGYATRRGSQCG